jgi:hypothetical protein
MKPIAANQEIMLFSDTSFSQNDFCPLESYQKQELNPRIVELEWACRAGRLFEMLPELSTPFVGSKAFIWDIHSTNHFVLINQGTHPQQVDNVFSLDPYCFFDDVRAN